MPQAIEELQDICAAWMMGATVWYQIHEEASWRQMPNFSDLRQTGSPKDWLLYNVGFLGTHSNAGHVFYRIGEQDE